MRARRIAILTLAGASALAGTACDTASSDWASFTQSFSPPSPGEAGRWAMDRSDPENQRRGIVLLGNAPWGGSPVYLAAYRMYLTERVDPLVAAASIEALGRHGEPADAELIAKQLRDRSVQVRVAAARALQRLHNPVVTGEMCSRLIDESEETSVRIELAIGLGQYPQDDVFQALAASLDARELAVNLASLDSLQLLTNQDFGLDRPLWLSWYRSTKTPFRRELQYLYPTFQRSKGFWDYVVFWSPLMFEKPGVPVGMQAPATAAPKESFGNVGDGKAPEAKGPS
jgi:hypothetical protein